MLRLLILAAVSSTVCSAADDISIKDASAASKASSELPRSATCSGKFSVTRQTDDDAEPDIWTAATFKMSFAPGKLMLDTRFRTEKVHVTILNPDGTKSESKVVNSPTDRVVILDNGKTVHKVTYTPRIKPVGCRIEVYPTRRSALSSLGFPLRDPVRPHVGILHVGKLVENLGPSKIEWSRAGASRFRGVYHVKNAPNIRALFQVDTAIDNQLISHSVFNLPSDVPATAEKLKWARTKDVWYVQQVDISRRYPGRPHQTEQVTYTDYRPNVAIPQADFELSSLQVPPRTRTIDRR